jgi:hypothetical protein
VIFLFVIEDVTTVWASQANARSAQCQGLTVQLELEIRAKVRGPARLIHSFDEFKSNFFDPFIFLPVWFGPLKPWVMQVKYAGSWVWSVTRFILLFIYIINYKFYLFGCI